MKTQNVIILILGLANLVVAVAHLREPEPSDRRGGWLYFLLGSGLILVAVLV